MDNLSKSGILLYKVVWKSILVINESIRRMFNEANTDKECAGVTT